MRRRVIWVVALVVAGLGLLLVLAPFFRGPRGHPPLYFTEHQVRILARMAAARGFLVDPPLAFPRGDIHSLYQWLALPHGGATLEDLPREWMDPPKEIFVDACGRALVYRCPSARDGSMFDLYSVGPNGVDNGGWGDDITCWPCADLATYRYLFAEEVLDEDWVRANLARLQRDAEGNVIGVPPDELEAIEEHGPRKAATSP